MGSEHEYGVPPRENEMRLLGQSDFGTSFFRIERIGRANENRSLRSRRISINWKLEKVILDAQLVSMSINNVVSALKIANGEESGTCRFLRPQEDSDFERPLQHSPGVTSTSMDFEINESHIVSISKEELLTKIQTTTLFKAPK